jgi:hypothetical protein
MSDNYQSTMLSQNCLPPGRTDTDVRGIDFDRTEDAVHQSRLLIADSDPNNDNKTGIYALLPDLNWVAVTPIVSTQQRFYRDMAISPGGSFGQLIYVTERITNSVMTVDSSGAHSVFASGFSEIESVTIGEEGSSLFVSDLNGVYRIRPTSVVVGPTIIMHDPSAYPDDIFSGPTGVSAIRFLFNESVLFTQDDVSITDNQGQVVPFSVSGSGSPFLLVSLGQPLLGNTYTITVLDSVRSAVTAAPIDGNDDGQAGGDAVLRLIHRRFTNADLDADDDVDQDDFGILQRCASGPGVPADPSCS